MKERNFNEAFKAFKEYASIKSMVSNREFKTPEDDQDYPHLPNMESLFYISDAEIDGTWVILEEDEKEYCAICGKIVEEDDQDYQIIQKRSGDLIVHNDCKNSQEYEELSMFGLNDAD